MLLRAVEGKPIIPLEQLFYVARLYSGYTIKAQAINGTDCVNTRSLMEE